MKDETFVFIQDVREKKSTARSARNRRTHNGKSGRVKFPSDNLSRKEMEAMNGEVKSYRLNEPMTWEEFKRMPDDIKISYIKLIREKFNAFDSAIAEMMGVSKVTLSLEIKRLGLGHGTKHGGNRTWNEREAFYAWAHGVLVAATVEESTEAVEQPEERQMASLEDICEPVPAPEIKMLPKREEKTTVIPHSGTMTFEGRAEDVLNTVSALLGGGKSKPLYFVASLPERRGV